MDSLPRFTAEDSIDRLDHIQPAFSRDPNRASLRMPPPVSSAKRCGPEAQRQCDRQLAQEIFLQCDQIDCETVCRSPIPDPVCEGCLARRESCEQEWRDFFANCATCAPGTTCKPDISSAPGGGYSYCCPSQFWPCGGSCRQTSCSIGSFDTGSCQCDCPPDSYFCRDDDGRVTACCDFGQKCSHGHCCATGQSWYANQCCDNDRICDNICCDGDDRHCDAGHCCGTDQRWVDGQCCDTSKICKEFSGTISGVPYGHEVCCAQSEVCASDPRFAGYGHCCPSGQTWCQGSYVGQCCDPGKCCGNACCAGTEHCSNDHCCPLNQDWASSGLTGPGVPTWQEGACCPVSLKPQKWCGPDNYGGFRCCDEDRCCDGQCCLVGEQCSNGHCCPIGQAWCGGKCCDPAACCPDAMFGTVCADLSSDAAHCGSCANRCITAEGQYCRNGQCVCLGNRPTCGGHCCALDQQCVGNVCQFPSVPCGALQDFGGGLPDTRTVSLGSTAGWYAFSYNTYVAADQIILRKGSPVLHGGNMLHDTGCVSKRDRVCLEHTGMPTTVEVEVIPDCAGAGDTVWDYTVNCPIYSSKQACLDDT